MKRILCFLLAVIMMLCLCGCMSKELKELDAQMKSFKTINSENYDEADALWEKYFYEFEEKDRAKLKNYDDFNRKLGAYLLEKKKEDEKKLNNDEQKLFDALIIALRDDFRHPEDIRVIEVGDPSQLPSVYDGPETVVVQLSGTDNACYKLCIEGGKVTADELEPLMKIADFVEYMDYNSDTGDCRKMSYYSIKKPSSRYDIKKINNALEEYWDNLGF